MADTKNRGRHRSSARPITPLTSFTKNIDTRKSLAVAATTGIALSIVAATNAIAAPDEPETSDTVNTDTISTEATTAEATTTDTAKEGEKAQEATPSIEATSDTLTQARLAVAANPEITAPDVAWSQGEVTVPVAQVQEAPRHTRTASPAQTQRHVAPAQSAPSTYVPPSVVGGSILDIAMRYQGVPYVYGGTSPRGFDCSGFVQYVYGQAGIGLPRTSSSQGHAGTRISAGEAKPGDLVAYGDHVGIYAGNGTMIHAPQPGRSVTLQTIYGHPKFVRVG